MTVVALAQCTGDDMPRSDDDIDIGLKNDQIMQRYLVRRIFKEAEFEVKETDGEKTIGFITGFDDKCLQMSTTPRHEADEPVSVIIFWPIRRIKETGRRIDALDNDSRSRIRTYSHALRAQCEMFMKGAAPTQQRRGPRRLDVVPQQPTPMFQEAQ